MTKKGCGRLALVACASVAAVGLLPGASAVAKTKTKTATFNQCVSTASAITDEKSGFASVFVPVPKNGKKIQAGTVTAVNSVGTRITHTYSGDLFLTLVSPAGKATALVVERGQEFDGYGTGPANCSGSLVQFSDGFGTPASGIVNPGPGNDNTPISGSFSPEQPLSGFLGGPARGFWTLVVTDCCDVDQGSLDALSLNLTYTYKVPVKKKGGK